MFIEFDNSCLENAKDKLETLLQKSRAEIKELLNIENKTYDNFVKPYQCISQNIHNYLTPIFHLDSVNNSELTQKVYSECLPLISKYDSEIGQMEVLYSAFKDIQDKYKLSLNDTQKKVVENEIRDFKLTGCGLSDNDKQSLTDIQLRLSELSKEFSQNLLNATNEFELIIEDEKDVKEIPNSDLELAKFNDEEDSNKTKYKFTLQMPSYIAYMTYGSNRDLREKLYQAYTSRAPQNSKIIDELLKLKLQKANLLGFENYAELSLATKSAKSTSDVVEFLERLASYAKTNAKEEIAELQQFAKDEYGIEYELQSYDIGYYSEKMRKKLHNIDSEFYRPYFEKKSAIDGLFRLLNKLFDISFLKSNTPTWDDKAVAYDVFEKDNDDKAIARIYIDLEARKEKRGGAWMDSWQSYSVEIDDTQLPSAYIVCNFPASSDDVSSLLRHDDVVTLFHEMGHALHHLLSKVSESFLSGVNGVAWDTVEFPSQFLEYFAYEKEVLSTFAIHYQTKEPLSKTDIDKLIKARNFQSSLALVRQLEFAMFDFKLYSKSDKAYNGDEVQELLDSVRQTVSPLIPPSYNKFQNGFSHIFAGGYSAGYYSYKWAEVLSADAFMEFKKNGIFDKETANKYKKLILESGSSVDMDKLFYEFAGHNPDVMSLLKIDGIVKD
jgi:oligopeptidase A